MITIYKYHLDRDQIHVKSRNAHVLEFLSVQIQRDEITLWALVDTEKPANYADIYVLGTGWNLGTKREPWLTKANFVDTVQDPDGLVWHIFGVLPENKKKEKATEREQAQEQKMMDKVTKDMAPLLNEAKAYVEKQYAKEFVKGYIQLLGELFDADLEKEFADLDGTVNDAIEEAYRALKNDEQSIRPSHDCKCESCKCHEGTDGATSRSDNDGARKTAPAEHAKATESECLSILRNFIGKTGQINNGDQA
jgi:hypothetical protein